MGTVRISGKEEKIILAGTEELVASDGAADKNITTKTLLSDRLLSKDVAGNSNVTLTATEAMYGQIVFTGALTGNINVTVPDATAKAFTVYNNTSGAYTLTFKTVTGTGVVITQGSRDIVQADGTNMVFAGVSALTNKFYGTQKWSKGADVASANALTLGADGNYFDITGTTSITSIATITVGTVIKLHFDGILTLTHHATDLILPGGANVTTAAGDEAEFVEYATGDWRCTCYTKENGRAIVDLAGIQSTATATTSTTLTSTPTLLKFTPTSYGESITMPDATTCTEGGPLHIIDLSESLYPVKILSSAGVFKGMLFAGTVSTVSLPDNTLAAGPFAIENLEATGATAQLYTANLTQVTACVAVDSDREFLLGPGGSNYLYGVIYKKSTNDFGSVTAIRSAAVAGLSAAVKSATDQVLVVSCTSSSTAFEAVVCTISGTTITPGTPDTETLSANISAFGDGCGLIQVGTSFITSYRVATPAAQIREITISGTTPTISAATVLDGTAGALIIAGDATHVIAVSTATTHLYTKPYTIGGLAAGTGTDTNSGTMTLNKLTALGTRFATIYNDGGSTVMGGIISLSGTTTTITTATLFSAGAINDASVVSGKVIVCNNQATDNFNLLSDSAGTASAGTAITLTGETANRILYVSGTDVVAHCGTTSSKISLIDCSGASPVKTRELCQAFSNATYSISSGTTNAMMSRSPNGIYGAGFYDTLTDNTLHNRVQVKNGVFSLKPPILRGVSVFGGSLYRGATDNVRWGVDSTVGVITKMECAP